MKKLFTVIIYFSDHTSAISQHEEKTPLLALTSAIEFCDRFENLVDRHIIVQTMSHLQHRLSDRGVWTCVSTNKQTGIKSATIIQTDKQAYLRPHH